MKTKNFPLISSESAKPRSRRAAALPLPSPANARESVSLAAIGIHALTTPSKLQDALHQTAHEWNAVDTWAMQSTCLAIVISLLRGHERRGACDTKVRESLMAIKLQTDRCIRNAETEGIYRKATADMPLDLD